ncbi:MAG: NFACT family protein [Deltaproteobacteria bacterium]
MPFDGIVLKAVSNELNSLLINGRVEKIFQPSRDEVFINIYSRGSKYRLIASSNASAPRIHLTTIEPENTPTPLNFCILLRKHLIGSKITQIFQPSLERILEIKFEGTNEIGDPSTRFLIIEIMGKHSNLILLNESRKIIDSIKHIDSDISRLREIMPGRDYVYPNTQSKLSIFDSLAVNKLQELFSSFNDNIPKLIVDSFSGFSPFAGKEFSNEVLSQKASADYSKSAVEALQEIIKSLDSNNLIPYIIGKGSEIHCLFSSHFDNEAITKFESMSNALDTYYLSKSAAGKLHGKKSELLAAVNNKLQKCLKRIEIQKRNISDSSERESFKLLGELITSNLYKISEGLDEVKVINYYDPNCGEITIPLNPDISPAKNAQAYYKKYLKAKKTFEAANIQLSQLEKDKYYFESLLFQIEEANSDSEIGEIRSELAAEGIINDAAKSKKSSLPSNPLEFVSSDGFTILVGKNNKQNDLLTFKIASRTDIWLHTRNIPGSHVVIRTEKKPVPETTLLEACLLSAYHSKVRNSTHVPVDFTEVKYVKKPGGAKPGFVIYDNFKTMIVDPDSSILERLKK